MFLHEMSGEIHSVAESFLLANPSEDPRLVQSIHSLKRATSQEHAYYQRLIDQNRFDRSDSEKQTENKLRQQVVDALGRTPPCSSCERYSQENPLDEWSDILPSEFDY